MPDATLGFAAAIEPREKMTPAEHAEKTLYLSSRITDYEGLIRFHRTPYLREPLEVFGDAYVRELLLCFATQVGKSTILYCILNHIVDYCPANTLLVAATERQADDISTKRLQHLFRDSPSLRRHIRRLNRLTYELDEMDIFWAWNSVSSVSAHPCRYIIMDETHSVGKDIRDAATERGKSKEGAKIVEASSPATPTDNIWTGLQLERDREAEREYEDPGRPMLPLRRYRAAGDCVVNRYLVPCPHCLEAAPLYPDRIWWPADCAIRELTWRAVYLCPRCDGEITDRHKPAMVGDGTWAPMNPGAGSGARVGYHLSSLYSLLGDQCSFGEIAARWIRARRDPEKRRNFLKNWLAYPDDPDEETTGAVSLSIDAGSGDGHRRGSIPDGVDIITAGFDIHKKILYGAIWGWSDRDHYRQGWLIDWNRWSVDMDVDPGAVLELMAEYRNTPYKRPGDSTRTGPAELWPLVAGTDSGYRAGQVYLWAASRPWIYAVKGHRGDVRIPDAQKQVAYYTRKLTTATPAGQPLPGGGISRYVLNTGFIKLEFYDAIGAGVHKFPVDGDGDLLDHIDSEELVRDPRTGAEFYKRRKKGDAAKEFVELRGSWDNHWLDCCIYARAAVEILAGTDDLAELAGHHYRPRSRGAVTNY